LLFTSQCSFDTIDLLYDKGLVNKFIWVNDLGLKILNKIQDKLVYLTEEKDVQNVPQLGNYEVWVHYNPWFPTDKVIGRRSSPPLSLSITIAGQDLHLDNRQILYTPDAFTTWFSYGDIYTNWFKLGEILIDNNNFNYSLTANDEKLKKQIEIVLVRKDIAQEKREIWYRYLVQNRIPISYIFNVSSRFFADTGKYNGCIEIVPRLENFEMIGYHHIFKKPSNAEDIVIKGLDVELLDFPYLEITARRINKEGKDALYMLAGIDIDDSDDDIDYWVRLDLKQFQLQMRTKEYPLLESVFNQLAHSKSYKLRTVKFITENKLDIFRIENIVIKRNNCVLVRKKDSNVKIEFLTGKDSLFMGVGRDKGLLVRTKEKSDKKNRLSLQIQFSNYDVKKFPYLALPISILSKKCSIANLNVKAEFDADNDGTIDFELPIQSKLFSVRKDYKIVEINVGLLKKDERASRFLSNELVAVNFYLDLMALGDLPRQADTF
jgi:hypothetical protein